MDQERFLFIPKSARKQKNKVKINTHSNSILIHVPKHVNETSGIQPRHLTSLGCKAPLVQMESQEGCWHTPARTISPKTGVTTISMGEENFLVHSGIQMVGKLRSFSLLRLGICHPSHQINNPTQSQRWEGLPKQFEPPVVSTRNAEPCSQNLARDEGLYSFQSSLTNG